MEYTKTDFPLIRCTCEQLLKIRQIARFIALNAKKHFQIMKKN
jgi:hypothetical protein